MEIRELTNASKLNDIIDIYKTYNPSSEEIAEADIALKEDITELGTNRAFFIAEDEKVFYLYKII
jgi:hypothetical protein